VTLAEHFDVGAIRVEIVAPGGEVVFDGPMVALTGAALEAIPPGTFDIFATPTGLPAWLCERYPAGTLHVPGVAA